jgi:16S rRNA (cytosine967-C5)-methyltransferase
MSGKNHASRPQTAAQPQTAAAPIAAAPIAAAPIAATMAADAVGQPSRTAALDLLQSGIERRGGFDEALGRAPFSRLNTRDRAFARALASTTLRRLGPIDRLLAPKLQRPPPMLVMNLLRLGAAQLLYMDTPAHAAVSTMVETAQAQRDSRPFKGLINGVLRGLGRDQADPSKAVALDEVAPATYAPEWLFNRWRAAFGEATAAAIAARIPEEPGTDLSLRDPADVTELASALEAEVLPGGSLRTAHRGDVTQWPGFEAGKWWVQDAAAAIPARLLDVKPGECVLDLCAAPGGKTLQLATAGGVVTAVDRSPSRLGRLRENLDRMGLSAEVVAADAAEWVDARLFDAVLLDAPCTATGTFRRHPDVLWAAKPSDLGKLATLQGRLLDAAARRVRPGGRLVYCVCSLEPEEGEVQARGFLRRHPEFSLVRIADGEGGAPARGLTFDGALRLHPGLDAPTGGIDGFFAARFIRSDSI